MRSILPHISALLPYSQLFRNPSPIHEFGALNMTAALCPWIMRHPEVKNNMEQFILQFVTPKFADTRPYLRAIVRLPSTTRAHLSYITQALEILGTATKHGLAWSNKAVRVSSFWKVEADVIGMEQNLEHHFTIVVSSLDDPELPVRVQAALALTELVLVHEEGACHSASGSSCWQLSCKSKSRSLRELGKLFKVSVYVFDPPCSYRLASRFAQIVR